MKYYEKLLEAGCFHREELVKLVGTSDIANFLIYEYQKKGYIERVKRDFYVVISLETKQPILSRYQIGANLFEGAYISHHSAFEYYGYGNQVFYECHVATKSRFRDFYYDGILYHRVEPQAGADVIENGKVRVTSLEQTVVDSIRDFEKIAGLEEVLRCIMLVPELKEEQLLQCLAQNGNGFLYQKCGYIFRNLQGELGLSEQFFQECKKHGAKSKRHLMKDMNEAVLDKEWGIYVPQSFAHLIDKGVGDYYAVG